MEHMQEAYETLIYKLKEEIKDVEAESLEEQSAHMDAETILMDFIFRTHGFKVLMELAKQIDVKHGKGINYEDYVDCTYEE